MNKSESIRDVLWQLSFQFKLQHKMAIKEAGLSLGGMHVRGLMKIAQFEDCTANLLCKMSGRDKGQITRIVKDLVEAGLVERLPNPNDKRSQLLVLTNEGSDLITRIQLAESQVEQQFKQGLTAEESDTFIRLAEKMLSSINQ